MDSDLLAKLKRPDRKVHKPVSVRVRRKQTKDVVKAREDIGDTEATDEPIKGKTKVRDMRGTTKVNRAEFAFPTTKQLRAPEGSKRGPKASEKKTAEPGEPVELERPVDSTEVVENIEEIGDDGSQTQDKTSTADTGKEPEKKINQDKVKKKTRRKLKIVSRIKDVEKQQTRKKDPGTAPTTDLPPPPSVQKQKDDQIGPSQPEKRESIAEKPGELIEIGDVPIIDRFDRTRINPLIMPRYFQNNREIFINFINTMFAPYKKELAEEEKLASCEKKADSTFSLMTHQKVIMDYINLYTPYRGVLVYHGLGSGKTCTSIAVAEGLKEDKKVIIMTPASLKRNYYEELKKCGDHLYKKDQFWEPVTVTDENKDTLSYILNLSLAYLDKHKIVWLVNQNKPSNYASYSSSEKKAIDQQLDQMINAKYKFISYNGLRRDKFEQMLQGPSGRINPFDSTVVIIDEAHNLVSRIVNKLDKPDSISFRMYHELMSATDCRIIMLSGTPVINYPNELGIMFNILRGYITTWKFKLQVNAERKVDEAFFNKILGTTTIGGNVKDYLSYDSNTFTLTITRNPLGFVDKVLRKQYAGVKLDNAGFMNNEAYIANVTRILKKNRIKRLGSPTVFNYKALPDKLDEFKQLFLDQNNKVTNMYLFKKRIIGLSSFFSSPQEALMPKYLKSKNFHIEYMNMSDFQFGVYEEARVKERKLEKLAKKKRAKPKNDLYDEAVSTYRIFSRAFCNFVFPRPDIARPMPGGEDTDEELLASADEDLLDSGVKLENVDGRTELEEVGVTATGTTHIYEERIKAALALLNEHKDKYLTKKALTTYSPKFLKVLDNIESNPGKHLVYSQFRTLEGIEIFKLVLEANGFAPFTISNSSGLWRVVTKPGEEKKPKFVLYTGTESAEMKEIVRNVYNGDWDFVPPSILSDINIEDNNERGSVVSIFMITASGAEGISLKNTKFVHLLEPYWHPVRIEQVIGRARRICSHQGLPSNERTVDVFLYLMKFSESQLENEATIELRLNDVSKKTGEPFTSDQALYEISSIKQEVNEVLLDAVKEASIDCALHYKLGKSKKNLKCFNFGTVDPNKFSFAGSYLDEETDDISQQNRVTIDVGAVDLTLRGKKYAYVKETGAVYDYDSYINGQAVQVGTLTTAANGKKVLNLL